MQVTMNMATGSFKSTSGSVLVALVVVLVAVMVAETSAQLVNVTFVNELDASVTVTLPASVLGSSETKTIAARSYGMMQVSVSGSLLGSEINFQVGECVYATAGSIQGRATGNTGTVKIYVTGHCETGVAGLQFVSSIEGDVITNLGCAAPVNSNCTGPIS